MSSKHRLLILLMIAVMGLTACNLGTSSNLSDPTSEPLDNAVTVTPLIQPSEKPTVEIVSPSNSDEFVVDAPILVSISAMDSVGVTRVQLFANGSIVKTVSSEALNGDQSLTAVLDYTPRTAGNVNMQVLAFRGAIASDPVELQVIVRSSANSVVATAQPDPSIPQIPNDGVCRALTNVGLNFREQPDTSLDNVILTLPTGTLAQIIGRLSDNSWWRISYGTNVGWVSAQFTTEYGNCLSVPVESYATPAPTVDTNPVNPTNAPTLTPNVTDEPIATNVPERPDLIPSNIDGDVSVVLDPNATDVTESYAFTITNIGNGISEQFSAQLTIEYENDPDFVLDLGVVSSLDPGQGVILTADLTFDSTGDYELRIDVDPDNEVEETIEINNRGDMTITVSNP